MKNNELKYRIQEIKVVKNNIEKIKQQHTELSYDYVLFLDIITFIEKRLVKLKKDYIK